MRLLTRLALVPAAVAGTVVLTAAPALAAPSDQDVAWVQAAHQSNLTEIAAGQAAQEMATTAEVRELGAMFEQMHTELDATLTQAAEELGVELPGAPSPEQQRQLAAVEQESGEAFDAAWVAQQIGSHVNTNAATEQELSAGSDERVLELARASAPVVQQHLVQLRQVAQQYGFPTSVPGGTGGQLADDGLRTVGLGVAGLGVLAVLAGAVGMARRRVDTSA